jgi:signal transduction histidine kinase
MLSLSQQVMEIASAAGTQGPGQDALQPESIEYVENFLKVYGYTDMIIIGPENDVTFSVYNKDSIGENLISLGMQETSLVNAVELSRTTNQAVLSDYQVNPHLGSPVLFLAKSLESGAGDAKATIILEIDPAKIDSIFLSRSGLGESGDVYLVGEDYLMRSSSGFLGSESIMTQQVYSPNSMACLDPENFGSESGTGMETFQNYMGNSVIGTYESVPETGWCILAEMSETEAYSEINAMLSVIAYNIAAMIFVGFFFSMLFSRSLSKPIIQLRDAALEIGKGNLATKIDVSGTDEIGDLASAFDQMRKDLKNSRRQNIKHASELEGEVNRRTNELDSKVKELMDTKTAVLNMMDDMDETNKELMKTKSQLEESLGKLKETDIKKDQFISIAAHELKTPLTSIHGFSQLLQQRKIANNFTKRNKYLRIMDHETKRLSKLVGDILDLSRIDIGSIKINEVDIDLNELLDTVKNEMEVHIKEKKLDSEYHVEKKLPHIMTDREKLTEVLINLINNSVKYTDKGKITVKVWKDKSEIHFMIKDTGMGIAKEEQEKIFDRFYQIDSSFTRKVGGTGLGLSLCKEFLEILGGRIWVESEIGKGSEFHFTLPIKNVPGTGKTKMKEIVSEKIETIKKMEKKKTELDSEIRKKTG